jgi:hypothetical protein
VSNAYLEILNLEPGATKGEIKSAYRKLSKEYHPDVNNSPDAQEKFVEINEAYKFLTEVGPTPHSEQISYDYNPYHQEYQERRRRARQYAFRQAAEAQRRQEASIKYALGIFNSIAYVILTFNALLAVDYLLPIEQKQEDIVSIISVREMNRGRSSHYRYDDLFFANFKMRVSKGQIEGRKFQAATVFSTPIFGKARYADLVGFGTKLSVNQSYGIYDVFGVLIPAIFLIALFYRFILHTLDHKFTLAILIVAVFGFQLYMFFKF